jgi:K+-sensing histidine kinase KdpD
MVGLSLVGLALLGALLEQQLGLHAYFSSAFFLLAVVLISLLWGTGPALLAILVSTLVLSYVSVPPPGRFDIYTWDGLLRLLPFILSGVIIARITAQREAARRRTLLAEQELESYTDELELDDRVKSEVLSVTVQELNTSLRTISEQVQVIEHPTSQQRERASSADVEQDALDRIDEQTHHLQELGDGLLAVGNVPTSEISLQLGPYDLRDICRTLVEEQSLQQGRTITLELPSLPVTVQMDRDYLKQVIATVLRQALTCSSPDGVVQVSISQQEGQILIQVRDAESDPAQDQEQYATGSCTEPLLVASHPVSREDTALWLVICKTIVEWYNGCIWYTAASDGKGYMCTIELPQDV